jgi:hypothetical protein
VALIERRAHARDRAVGLHRERWRARGERNEGGARVDQPGFVVAGRQIGRKQQIEHAAREAVRREESGGARNQRCAGRIEDDDVVHGGSLNAAPRDRHRSPSRRGCRVDHDAGAIEARGPTGGHLKTEVAGGHGDGLVRVFGSEPDLVRAER